MKSESDPVTEDEWLIRLVWENRISDQFPIISPNSFEPKKQEYDGISLFRKACLADPLQVLLAIAEEKRHCYAVVQISVDLLRQLGLEIKPSPIASVPGHVVLPRFNFGDYKANKQEFVPLKLSLAMMASENIIRMPIGRF